MNYINHTSEFKIRMVSLHSYYTISEQQRLQETCSCALSDSKSGRIEFAVLTYLKLNFGVIIQKCKCDCKIQSKKRVQWLCKSVSFWPIASWCELYDGADGTILNESISTFFVWSAPKPIGYIHHSPILHAYWLQYWPFNDRTRWKRASERNTENKRQWRRGKQKKKKKYIIQSLNNVICCSRSRCHRSE